VPNVIPNAQVVINFANCPQARLCQNGSTGTVLCVGPNGQGTVSGTTDINGQVSFSVVGSYSLASGNFPEPDPAGICPGAGNQGYFGCATCTVTAPGFPPAAYPNLIVATFDMETVDIIGVGPNDISTCLSDLNNPGYEERSDYDTTIASGDAGCLTPNDLSQIVACANGGGSTNSCAPAFGGTPCP
jgi:hypothetical protein